MPGCFLAWFWLSLLTSAVHDNQVVKNKVTTVDKDKYEKERTFKECEKAAPTFNTEREQKWK